MIQRRFDADPVIFAHELAEYGFCARAWWLRRVMGVVPSNATELARGTAMHRVFGWQRLAAQVLWRVGLLLLLGAVIALLVQVL